MNNSFVELKEIISPARLSRAGDGKYPILSMTMHGGLVDQAVKFKKRVASADTSPYKRVKRNQLVVGFPIDEGVLSFQKLYDEAIVSPAYDIWDLINPGKVDTNYLERFLRSPIALHFYASKLRSTTARRRTLPKDTFLELQVPLPPLPEQRRIAAILDKADAICRKRQQAIRLTEEFLRSVFLDMFGDPVLNPKGWPEQRLDEISEIQSGITKGRKANGQEMLSVPYMRVANVQDGHIDLGEIKEIEATSTEIARYLLKKGDILLTEGGDPDKLGRGAVWHGEIDPCIHQNHIFRVRANTEFLLPEYASAQIGSIRGKKYFLKSAKQTTGIASINKTQLSGFPALIPPVTIQRKFVEIVRKQEELAAKNSESATSKDDCFNSLVQRAFRGNL